MKFSIMKDNQIVECDIVFTFQDEANGRSYIVYTDGTKDKDGIEEIYSSRYTKENGTYVLEDIESDYEWNLIDNMLSSKLSEVDIR